jgi:hypothetical protein
MRASQRGCLSAALTSPQDTMRPLAVSDPLSCLIESSGQVSGPGDYSGSGPSVPPRMALPLGFEQPLHLSSGPSHAARGCPDAAGSESASDAVRGGDAAGPDLQWAYAEIPSVLHLEKSSQINGRASGHSPMPKSTDFGIFWLPCLTDRRAKVSKPSGSRSTPG